MLKFIDQKEEEAFARDGYIVRKVLDQHQIDSARNEIEAWMQKHHPGWPTSLPFHGDGMTYFSTLEVDGSVSASISEKLDSIVGSSFLQGTSGAVTKQPGVAIKLANGPELPLHLHSPIALDPFARVVLCWCSLVDADENSGALFVIPRSHRLYRHIHMPGDPYYFGQYRDELVRKYGKAVPVKAGEAVYFDNVLLHGSFPNQHASPRMSVLVPLMTEDSNQVSYRRADDGSVEVVDGLLQMFSGYSSTFKGRKDYKLNEKNPVLRRLPFWNRKPTFEELEILLASDLCPSEEFDPLEFLCGPEKQDESQTFPTVQPNRNPLVRIAARVLPGAIKRPLRKIVDGIRSRRATASVAVQPDFAAYPPPTETPQPFADPRLNETLHREGFVTTQFLEVDEIDRLAHNVRAAEYTHDKSDVHIPTHFRLSAFSNDAAYKERLFDAAWDCLKDKVEAILPGFEPLVINLFDKQPGSGYDPVPIHQNPSFVEEPAHKTVSLWIPFSDVDKDNGTVGVLPRSHNRFNRMRAGNMAHEDVFAEVQSDLENKLFAPIILKKGEMLALDDSIIHWSYPNVSDRERKAIQLIMVPKGVPHIYYFYDDTAKGHPMMDRYEVDKNFFFGFNCKARPETLKHIDRLPYRYRPITGGELLGDSAHS